MCFYDLHMTNRLHLCHNIQTEFSVESATVCESYNVIIILKVNVFVFQAL